MQSDTTTSGEENTSLILRNAYQTYLKQWYAQSSDAQVALWRKYHDPGTGIPKGILNGSTASVVVEQNKYCGVSTTSGDARNSQCSISNWNLKTTQMIETEKHLPTTSLPVSMQWFLEGNNIPPQNIKIPGGISLTNYSNLFFHPTAGLILNIANDYVSISPATGSSVPLAPSKKMSQLVDSNAIVTTFEQEPTGNGTSCQYVAPGNKATVAVPSPSSGYYPILSFWLYISGNITNSLGTIVAKNGKQYTISSISGQENMLQVKLGSTLVFNLSCTPYTWIHYIFYNVKKKNEISLGILENGIPCFNQGSTGSANSILQSFNINANVGVFVAQPQYCYTISTAFSGSTASITNIISTAAKNSTSTQNVLSGQLNSITVTNSVVQAAPSTRRYYPPPLWLDTPSTVWLDVMDSVSTAECTQGLYTCNIPILAPNMALSPPQCSSSFPSASVLWNHTWGGSTESVSIWVKMTSVNYPVTTYDLQVKESTENIWQQLATIAKGRAGTKNSEEVVVWSAGGTIEMKKGSTYNIRLLFSGCQYIIPVLGILICAGNGSVINFREPYMTTTTTKTENNRRYRYCIFTNSDSGTSNAYCSIVNPYTGVQSAAFYIDDMIPNLTQEFKYVNNCSSVGEYSSDNCTLLQFPASSLTSAIPPPQKIQISRKVISIDGIISQENVWHIVATFSQQLTPTSVLAILSANFNDIMTYQYRQAIFSTTGIYYSANDTKVTLQKKLSTPIAAQFVIQLNILPEVVSGVTVPFTVNSFRSISDVFPLLYHNVKTISRYSYLGDEVLIIDQANNVIVYTITGTGQFVNASIVSSNIINTLPLTNLFFANADLFIKSALSYKCISLVASPSATPPVILAADVSGISPAVMTIRSEDDTIRWGSTIQVATQVAGGSTISITLLPPMGYMPQKPSPPSSFSLANFRTKITTSCNVSNAFVTQSGTRGKELCSNMVNLYLATTLAEYEKQKQVESTASPEVVNLLKTQNLYKDNVDYNVTYDSKLSYTLDNSIEIQGSRGESYTVSASGLQPLQLQLKIIVISVSAGILFLSCMFALWKISKKKKIY
jgi:hypothetical protein